MNIAELLQKQKWPVVPVAFIAIIMLSVNTGCAQVLMPDIPANRYLMLAEEQYQQAHYTMAAQSARQFLDAPAGNIYSKASTDIDKANYYLALSGIKTGMAGYEKAALGFMDSISNPGYKQRIAFTLAQNYFQHNEHARAITFYEMAGIGNLNNKEIADAKFELAYCYFNNRQFDKAEPLLVAIKELRDGKYYMAGNYYYGLLAYNQNKYKEALKSFERIKETKDYRNIVPYYIAEIYYFMGNRAKAMQQADTVIKRKEKSFYDNELHLLAGQCLFEEQKYGDARPYFEYYYEHADKIRKQDLYEMAYCCYKVADWQNAVEKFKMLSDARDSLGQTSMYLLGDCYLKISDKQSARNAFGICADMSFNPALQEASMILFAKASFEVGYNDDALRALDSLMKAFPNTEYKDEANTLISDLLVKTNNYSEALKHLNEVNGRKEKDFKLIYQKATFGYAIQQFRGGDLISAAKYFDLSTQNAVDADYEQAANFWKGELAFRLHHYNDVITYSQDFITKRSDKGAVEQISPLATLQHAYLNMGYAAMETQNYNAAQIYFNHAQQAQGQDNYSGLVAALREADAVFLQKNYSRALVLYDKIILTDSVDADYARYQKSVLLGLLGRNSEKIEVLKSLVNSTPPSAYANNARYELAITYMESDKYELALTYLQQLTDSIGDKSFAPKSWMKIGFIYQQVNDLNMAIDAYKHVVIEYPASEERLPALDALKNLYIQSNQPAAYTRMLKENRLPSADSSVIDSTYYAAAETQFSNGKWANAAPAFSNYLEQYPNGIFAVKAHYYRAESNYQLKKYKEAREDYSKILAGNWNEFFENSARRAAGIAYEDKDYGVAFDYYLKLRASTSSSQTKGLAYNGLMKSGFNSGKFMEAGLYADTLIALPAASAEVKNDAFYYKAKSLLQFDSLDAAAKIFKQLSSNKNGDVAAESRFHIAEILYTKEKYKDAEAAANESIKQSAGYDYWIVKSYLLLADILVKENDYFNAKATLQSIIMHTKMADLKQEAGNKLKEVKILEKNQSKLSEE